MSTTPSAGAPVLDQYGAYWRIILGAMPVAAYLCDPDGLITYFNSRAVELWGREPKLGDPTDRYCGSFRLYSSDGAPIRHQDCWMALAIRNGREYSEREIIVERPGGDRRVVLAHANPFHDQRGRLAGAVNVLLDVTEEMEARRAQEHLAAIVESSDDAIVSKSLQGVIRTWNSSAERIFGYTAAEAVGRHISLIIPPDRLAEEDMILSRLRAGERIEHFESVRRRKDGQPVSVSLTISPVRDNHGKIIGASKVARDISDRKRTERALREANRLKDQFLATLAHELRNPLAPIRTGLELMRDLENDPEQLESIRGTLERQTEHLRVLVDDLLDVSRITRGKLLLRKAKVQLDDLVQSAVEVCQPLIEQEHHELTVEMPAEPIYLNGDRHRLTQILSNLLSNAVKYTPRGGRIWLEAKQDGADVTIVVRDTGLGVPPDMQERIFELFTQIPHPEKGSSGLGVGLTLVHSLVQMHGGAIEVHSEGVNRGTEFRIRLPTTVEAPAEHAQPPKTDHQAPIRRRILIADDNHDAAGMLSMLLIAMGSEVRTAQDGEDAFSTAAEFLPEIVLMDLGMPRVDGYEAARRLREQPWGKQMTLVALTGWGDSDNKQRAKEAGFDHYLVKPVASAEIQTLLAGII